MRETSTGDVEEAGTSIEGIGGGRAMDRRPAFPPVAAIVEMADRVVPGRGDRSGEPNFGRWSDIGPEAGIGLATGGAPDVERAETIVLPGHVLTHRLGPLHGHVELSREKQEGVQLPVKEGERVSTAPPACAPEMVVRTTTRLFGVTMGAV